MGTKPITTALRAALNFARDSPARCDERTIESLLWGALGESPDLAEALTGYADLEFFIGIRDCADIAGIPPGNGVHDVAVVIEVKLRAAFNWRKVTQKSQLDAYAERNPDAKLILVASDKSIRQFHARGTGEFDSYDRWNENVVSLDDLFEILDATVSADEHDASAEKVGRIVAREGNWL